MNAQLRAELLKLRTTRTTIGLLAAMVGLIVFAVALHGLTLPVETLSSRDTQLSFVYGWGERFGALIAGLLGAMAITAEIRHGTIRPTFLVTPQRARVVVAKAGAGMLAGLGFGLIAGVVATGAGGAVLAARGIDSQLTAGDHTMSIVGAAGAAALWAAIGVGVGAVVRAQVPALVGITAWLLFVENVLVQNLVGIGRFGPGAAAQALSGQGPDTLLAPGIGVLVVACYGAAAIGAGWRTTLRRDVT
jgi:ABC-2 type transport system permease protein